VVKLGLTVAAMVAVAAFFLFGRSTKAEAVRECIEETGATVESAPHFAQAFPYLVAAASNERVGSYPELDDSSAYGVRYGTGEAVLFVAKDADRARRFERTMTELAASGGAEVPTRRVDNVLLLWTQPPSLTAAVDDCLE
jgi:hypothetical protein